MTTNLARTARWFWVLGSLVLLAGACAYRQEKGDNGGGIDPQARIATGKVPSFAQVRDQVFKLKCTTCHKHAQDFQDYAATYSQRDKIRESVFELRSMPKDDTLSPDQAALLKAWLDGGSPEQALTQAPAPAPSPSAPAPALATWANVQSRFFGKYCTHCHSGPSPDADLDVTDLNQVRAKIQEIADRALTDRFVAKFSMPPKEQNFARVAAENKLLLVEWWLTNQMPGPNDPLPPIGPSN